MGFQAASFTRRNKAEYHQQRSDPVRAAENHLRRDLLLTQWVKEQADGCGLATLEIDGALALDKVARIVEQHFELLLRQVKENAG